MFEELANTPVPTILIVAGVIFIFIAIGGQLGATVVTTSIRKGPATVVGVVLLASGLGLYILGSENGPEPSQKPPQQPSGPEREARVFTNPTEGGVRLDWCLTWAKDCGKPAADAWCRGQGYEESVSFLQDENIGQQGQRTLTYSDNKLCDQPHCDGFRVIECVK